MTRKSKQQDSSLCSIRRTFKRTHGTLSLATGKSTMGRSEIVTEACNAPLFGGEEGRRGICRSCTSGWEHEDNRFASPEEKTRAMSENRSSPGQEVR